MVLKRTSKRHTKRQAEIDREQWRQIDLNRLLIWANTAITLVGLAGLIDDLRFWHDKVLVPAGFWLKDHIPFALFPFRIVYELAEWWRWAVHGLFALISLHLPPPIQSLVALYIFLGNGTLLFLRRNVSARDRVPYARLQFLKGIAIQLVHARTIARWLLARPRWHEEYAKYFIDALLCVLIWCGLAASIALVVFGQFELAKLSLLVVLLAIYSIIMSDGLYFGSTRWYTVIYVVIVAFVYTVDSVYRVCCLA